MGCNVSQVAPEEPTELVLPIRRSSSAEDAAVDKLVGLLGPAMKDVSQPVVVLPILNSSRV